MLNEIPANSTCVGVPAHIVKRDNVKVAPAKIDLDQIHIPDPVAQELNRLEEEINKLKDDAELTRTQIIGVDGPTDYMRQIINKLSAEDFSHYLSHKPGVFIRLGTRNEEKGYTTLPHNNDFLIDEDAFPIGTDTCVQFVLDNMNGIDMEKVYNSDERKYL